MSFAGLSNAGHRVTTDALATATGGITRELSLPLRAPGTTAYLSFVIRPEDTLHQGLFNGFFGLRLDASTVDDLFIGKPGGGALGKWVLEDIGGAQQHASGVDVIVDEEFLLVVRVISMKATTCLRSTPTQCREPRSRSRAPSRTTVMWASSATRALGQRRLPDRRSRASAPLTPTSYPPVCRATTMVTALWMRLTMFCGAKVARCPMK